ncbi:hypothetical protein NPIL_113761 [Nephila pilipes]|uniref:Uncharacterized protein n=1 Tax=Nephila pilipes TaxID=299642 RepID=A0A8X6PKN0_NEPPI|nr:hypothetical protein NPIL_113761 [Nephila pilipes]
MRGFLPSSVEVIVCVFIHEIIKHFFKWYCGRGAQTQITVIPEQSFNKTGYENKKKRIPTFKICEGLDIKVQLPSIEKRDTWHKKEKKPTKDIPIVRSEIIFKICNALNLSAKLELNERWNINCGQKKSSSRFKTPPIVNSVGVYKICLALGLPAQLNEKA